MEPISKVNLERITNGIYAFTMTLMIRNIQLPQVGSITTDAAFENYLDGIIFSVIDFVGAFLILAMFWLFYFQMLHRMKTVDLRFIYLHFLSLMVVVFVPFTQSFASNYSFLSGELQLSEILFQVNYFILAILLVSAWYYVQSHPVLLEPALTGAESAYLTKKFYVPLGIAILGILLLLFGFSYIDVLYLAPFVIIGLFIRPPPETM